MQSNFKQTTNGGRKMATFKITGYHGTDKSVVDDILRDGFRCKDNKEHWLGDGIYLYKDKALAEWWTTNPSKKHGMDIKTPVIIECSIEVDEDKVLNLCTLKGYEEYVGLYNNFLGQWKRRAKDNAEINFKQLRCAFFNCLLLSGVDIIIAPFILPDQPYMPQYFDEQHGNAMHITYPEIQICVFPTNQDIIKNKRLYCL